MSTTINMKQAYDIISDKYEDLRIDKGVCFQNLFVFSMSPKDGNKEGFIMDLVGVNKDTGNVFMFNPMVFDFEEFFKVFETDAVQFR